MTARAGAAEPLAERIVACQRCPRLIEHCRQVARVKRRAYRDQEYWGAPVPSFGSTDPRLLVVGLAPGAHGANRTGRIFTGDSSGDWLYRALHTSGFANQPRSIARGDGLELRHATVSCAARCAPPQNKPTARELANCLPYLVEELESFSRLAVIIALGKIGFAAVLRAWREAGRPPFPRPWRFAHGAELSSAIDGAAAVTLIASYHPSRQNTQTGRLTRRMFHRPFRRARALISDR